MFVDFSLDLSGWINLIDIIIVGLLIWGTYKGYKNGSIVESIALFTLIIGLGMCIVISKQVYRYLEVRSDIPDLFTIVTLGFLFIGAIYGMTYVSGLVKINVAGAPKNGYNRALGGLLGFMKFFLLTSVYVVMMFKIEQYAHFMPEREQKSKIKHLAVFTVTQIFPYLKMSDADMKNNNTKINQQKKEKNDIKN